VAQAAHDSAAFTRLYTHYFPRLYAFARYRVATEQEAEEVVAETFLRVVEALDRFRWRHAQSFAAWLFRIARNAATDFHRRRRIAVAWDLLPEALHPLQPDGLDAGMLRRETVERLRALLLRLNPDERELLALRFVGELTLQEIGLIVGKSESGVQRQLTRILRRLKEQYRDD
jgi:RNA polymerase sigma-70 factor (ECF subfamily)